MTKKTRVANEYYPTAFNNLVTPLLDRLQLKGRILEPCAGDGAIAALIPGCVTNELHPKDFTTDWQLDASNPQSWLEFGAVDWVITNPPFSLATPIIALALQHARVGVVMLLRITWLEPCRDRAALLIKYADCMTDLIPVNPRPPFRSDTKGTDMATVAWFVWRKDFSWSKLGVRSQISFLTDWKAKDKEPTIQPAHPSAARGEPVISASDRLLMAIGATE